MSAQLEIIFSDKGGGDGQPMHSPGAGSAYQERTPGPADRVTGPKRQETKTGEKLESAVLRVADVLGVGGLFGKAVQLKNAFSSLWDAVTASTRAHEQNAVATKASATRPDLVGPKNPKGPETLDAEWEFKSPKPGLTTTGPNRTGGELIRVPQPLSTRHAATRVETIGVTSTESAAAGAATGPAAGAGSSAALMGRLTAAAAPAALAVAGFAAGIAIAGVAVKKFVDVANSEATRLSGLSGHLAGSTARAELRSEFADIRRAQRVGPGLAQIQDSTSQVMEKVADVNTELLKACVDFFGLCRPVIPVLVNTLNLIAAGIPVTVDGITDIVNYLNRHTRTRDELNQQVINIGKFVGALVDIANADRDARLDDDPFTGLFFGAAPPTPRRAPARKPSPKDVGLFGGGAAGAMRGGDF